MPDQGGMTQRVVVTGAAGGIGRAVVERLLDSGCQVLAADIDEDGLSGLPSSDRLSAIGVDISDPRSAQALATVAQSQLGGVDALVNNAGIDAPPGLAWEITEDHWRRLIDVNLSGAWWCTQAVLPAMRAQKHGRIVMISSLAARLGSDRYSPAYAAAKAGLLGLTVGLATQLEADGILCNAITPGATGTTGTPMTPEEEEHLRSTFPLGPGGVEPIVEAVCYLLGTGGNWISGATLNVSGGQLRGI